MSAAFGLLVLALTFTPLVNWWAAALSGAWDNPRGETLIVLAAESAGNEFPGRSSYWRAYYAAGAWAEGGWSRMVISGGAAASQMKRLLVCRGVPGSVIEVEELSASTRESALWLARRLQGVSGSKVLLTSDFHIYRSWRALRVAGLETRPRPVPDAGKQAATTAERWPVFLRLAEETVKLAYYKVHGWI